LLNNNKICYSVILQKKIASKPALNLCSTFMLPLSTIDVLIKLDMSLVELKIACVDNDYFVGLTPAENSQIQFG
jgi:hypothetical protein